MTLEAFAHNDWNRADRHRADFLASAPDLGIAQKFLARVRKASLMVESFADCFTPNAHGSVSQHPKVPASPQIAHRRRLARAQIWHRFPIRPLDRLRRPIRLNWTCILWRQSLPPMNSSTAAAIEFCQLQRFLIVKFHNVHSPCVSGLGGVDAQGLQGIAHNGFRKTCFSPRVTMASNRNV